jgi:hypothetical protein
MQETDFGAVLCIKYFPLSVKKVTAKFIATGR